MLFRFPKHWSLLLTFKKLMIGKLCRPCLFWMRHARRRFPVGASPPRKSLQPEAIGAVIGGNEVAEAFDYPTARLRTELRSYFDNVRHDRLLTKVANTQFDDDDVMPLC